MQILELRIVKLIILYLEQSFLINMSKILLILPTLLILLSCGNKENKTQKEDSSLEKNTIAFFEPSDLGAFGSPTKLLIYANFDECGEWGGHEESFEIFTETGYDFYAVYKRTKVDCDKINELYGTPEFQQPAISKKFQLSDDNIIAINNYLSALVKSKIKERFPGHAGQSYGAINSDSTFVINVYDNNKENLDNYNKLLESFKIEKVSYEYR